MAHQTPGQSHVKRYKTMYDACCLIWRTKPCIAHVALYGAAPIRHVALYGAAPIQVTQAPRAAVVEPGFSLDHAQKYSKIK